MHKERFYLRYGYQLVVKRGSTAYFYTHLLSWIRSTCNI